MPIGVKVAALAPLAFGLICCVQLARPGKPGWPGVAGAGGLMASTVIWSQSQGYYEGATVIRVAHEHGLTIADLSIVPSLGIAAAVVARSRR